MDNKKLSVLEKPVTVQVSQERHIALARQEAKKLAEALGFGQTDAYSIATAVSELANNLVSHTSDGGLGGGLSGARRLMDEFEISSRPGVGTRIVTRKWQPCIR